MKPSTGILNLGDQYTGTRETIINNIQNGKLYANKRIAGIPCHDSVTTEEMLKFFTEENLQISNIKDKLQKAGLPFKAIVPTAFYDEIKKKKGVYTFKNIDEKGFTSVSKETIGQFVEKEEASFNKLSMVVMILITTILCAPALLISEYYTWQWHLIHNSPGGDRFWGMVGFSVVIGVVIAFMQWGVREGSKFLLERFVFNESNLWKRITSKLSVKGYETFWPQYQDSSYGPKVKLDFIAPNSDSIPNNILQWKEAGYNVHISAQKEAFSLDISPLEDNLNYILAEIQKQRQTDHKLKVEARRLRWQLFWSIDPIISTEEGQYTVLLDAYGEKSFVSEREVMESVQEYYGQKLKQFQTFLN